jgi:hypothetical protein
MTQAQKRHPARTGRHQQRLLRRAIECKNDRCDVVFNEVRRSIPRETERELWARAAGRCEFAGCNTALYLSPLTKEHLHIAEKAHVYSFSEKGPRGQGPHQNNPRDLNSISNLMLVCHHCHVTIDKHKDGGRYPAPLLRQWKEEHERRIWINTGIGPKKKSHVVLYGANIGHGFSPLQPEDAHCALFPKWYPAEERPICLSMVWDGRDDKAHYWETEDANLQREFDSQVKYLIREDGHFSIFAFAPIPLLIRLGALFTDKVRAQVYQLHREPEQTWAWSGAAPGLQFLVRKPAAVSGNPALIISLSARVDRDRVISALGRDASIWDLTIRRPENDFLKTVAQLSAFRTTCRELIARISEEHGIKSPLSIFPAMPVACAVELGRIRMPKADMPWVIYDYHNARSAFLEAITIGE